MRTCKVSEWCAISGGGGGGLREGVNPNWDSLQEEVLTDHSPNGYVVIS